MSVALNKCYGRDSLQLASAGLGATLRASRYEPNSTICDGLDQLPAVRAH